MNLRNLKKNFEEKIKKIEEEKEDAIKKIRTNSYFITKKELKKKKKEFKENNQIQRVNLKRLKLRIIRLKSY